MGLNNKYSLRDKNDNEVATVIPLNKNMNSVAGLSKSLGLDEYIISDQRLDEIKCQYNLNDSTQTSIFDYL